MEAAKCSKTAYLDTFLDNVQDLTVVAGPAARIRPQNVPDEYFSCMYNKNNLHYFIVYFVALKITVNQECLMFCHNGNSKNVDTVKLRSVLGMVHSDTFGKKYYSEAMSYRFKQVCHNWRLSCCFISN